VDQYFSLFHHTTCNVHGGDGFAFVIQNHPDTITAVGGVGGQMGFGGIQNSLAIAFDTWQNPVITFLCSTFVDINAICVSLGSRHYLWRPYQHSI